MEEALIEELLERVKAVQREYERKSRENAYNFNVFEITHIHHLEVRMSLLLHELLNSDGKHGMGTAYLERFFEDVLGFTADDDELRGTNVIWQKKEYTPAPDRKEKRIDIVIDTPYRYIPIEIKINAGEGENQCYDYFVIGREENRRRGNKYEWGLFFLTLYGEEPKSTKDREECKRFVRAVSWKNQITLWLENIIELTDNKRINVREVLKQYLSAIRKLTGQNEEGLQMELNKLIDSGDKMKAAVAVSNGLQKVKDGLLKKLFDEIDDKFGREHEKVICSYSSNDYPSLGYKVREITSTSYVLAVRFEISNDNTSSSDGTCYVGFTVFEKTEKGYKGIEKDTLRELREKASSLFHSPKKLDDMHPTKSWLGLLHVPNFGKSAGKDEPNFKNHNQAYYDLYDDEKRKEFADVVAEKLSELASWVKAEE